MKFLPVLAVVALCSHSLRAELRVDTDFEGGSATIASIDEEARLIRLQPGGDPSRGWPCWWYLRIEGAKAGETVRLELRGSDRPYRNNGKDTGKPLSPDWAMPASATYSVDGETWRHTGLGTRATTHITYEVTGTGGPIWVAWGPPFTLRESEALFAAAIKKRPGEVESFELARTREGRPVRGLHVSDGPGQSPKPAVWIQARQHAWESGSSWVARGFAEWLVSDEAEAVRLREEAEIWIVPIMDVDNVATGNGGKEANPRDHNRDWDESPVYPEVAAAQARLRSLAAEKRLAVFLDLHNPAARDSKPFFFFGPPELLAEAARANRIRFLAGAAGRISGPLLLDPKPHLTGPSYHPLWRQMSGQWVDDHGNADTLAACLETSWNTRHSTTEGYRAVGRQLGEAVAAFLRGE